VLVIEQYKDYCYCLGKTQNENKSYICLFYYVITNAIGTGCIKLNQCMFAGSPMTSILVNSIYKSQFV